MKWILLFIGLYPVILIVDKINGTAWSKDYLYFMELNWVTFVVLFLSYKLYLWDKDYKYQKLDELRENQFYSEHNRYADTPYVSPILLRYLKTPPISHRPSDYAYVTDTFYQQVVNVFRDRVFILADTDSFEPTKRPNFISVLGFKNVFLTFFYFFAPFAWALYLNFAHSLYLFESWAIFTVPLVFASWMRGSYMVNAIIMYNPSALDEMLEVYDTLERKVTWRDAFPDRDVGITFLRAYVVEKEKRARYHFMLQRVPVPIDLSQWSSRYFPPYLYPSNNLPDWENEYEPLLEQKRTQVAAVETANVVPFKRIK